MIRWVVKNMDFDSRKDLELFAAATRRSFEDDD
jgi:hypothetical protein